MALGSSTNQISYANSVYTQGAIRIARPGKAESTSGLGRAGFCRITVHLTL